MKTIILFLFLTLCIGCDKKPIRTFTIEVDYPGDCTCPSDTLTFRGYKLISEHDDIGIDGRRVVSGFQSFQILNVE